MEKKKSKLPMFSKYVQFSEFFQNFLLYAIISSCVFFRISCPTYISYILVGTKFYFQKIEIVTKMVQILMKSKLPKLPEAAQTCFIKRTDRSSLFEGLWEQHSFFLLPLLHPASHKCTNMTLIYFLGGDAATSIMKLYISTYKEFLHLCYF